MSSPRDADRSAPGVDLAVAADLNPTADPTLLAPAMQGQERIAARRERMRLVLRSKSFVIGGAILVFWVLAAIFGEMVVPKDVYATDTLHKFVEPGDGDFWL